MTSRSRTWCTLWMLAALCGGVQSAPAQSRLTPREQQDPLEPWSMEAVPGGRVPASMPAPLPARPDTAAAHSTPAAGRPAASPSQPPLVPDDSDPAAMARARAAKEKVLVVRCRQLLIGQPAAAERLGELLRGGASFESAWRAVGKIDLTDRTREYAIDELQPDLRQEVESLPEGGWSRARPWSGRTALFQVVTKETRERGSVPELGAGLSADEQSRLARAQRDRPPPSAVAAANEATGNTQELERAAVVQQADVTPPEGVTTGATVTVLVQVGRTDDVMNVQIQASTDPQFNQAAIQAARRSTYRSAQRNGVPEPDMVPITFNFPGSQPD